MVATGNGAVARRDDRDQAACALIGDCLDPGKIIGNGLSCPLLFGLGAGYQRDGAFMRRGDDTGYWSGRNRVLHIYIVKSAVQITVQQHMNVGHRQTFY